MSVEGKIVLITGACGSIGSELVKQCLTQQASRVYGHDRNDIGLFMLQQRLDDKRFSPLVGDIRDISSFNAVLCADYCFHCAAMKHVTMAQQFPHEATDIIINGTQNIVSFCQQRDIKLINISTDKAVMPVSVMGAAKLIAEQTTSNAGYSSVRFGNVTCAAGSVIPVWTEALLSRKPLYVSDLDVTRFVMSIDEAVSLVLSTVELPKAIYILKMRAFMLRDLLSVFEKRVPKLLGVVAPKAVEVGLYPGERMHERLASDAELPYLHDQGKLLAILSKKANKPCLDVYSNLASMLSRDELAAIIEQYLKTR